MLRLIVSAIRNHPSVALAKTCAVVFSFVIRLVLTNSQTIYSHYYDKSKVAGNVLIFEDFDKEGNWIETRFEVEEFGRGTSCGEEAFLTQTERSTA